jgi:hypothetical protein
MDRLLERCAGLDVHKKTVTACVRVPSARGVRHQEVRTFGTTTEELLALRDWLTAQAVTPVALESTGVYWKPVYYIVEEAVTCVLVNAAHLQHTLAATHKRDCALGARYRRLARHRGHQKAIIAVARTLLVIAYELLARETTYEELGDTYFDHRHQEELKRRALKTLQRLGYKVALETAA